MALALLWHMHQPDYRDPRTGRPVMPWTRLHALRGYRDLAVEIVRDEVACTVNMAPSLIDQLLWYAGGGDDEHLELTAKAADALDERDQAIIRETFVAGNPVMIDANPAWRRLAHRVRAGDRLDVGDYRDIQVWSNLAWCGATAYEAYPELGHLRDKATDFDEDDKRSLLAAMRAICAELPGLYRELGTRSAAKISCSPYFHPILPLLVDTAHAARCQALPWDPGFRWPDDARLQLNRARDRVEAVFGTRPIGLWPSEGSVSPEAIEIAAECGFQWFASDQGVLDKSDHTGTVRSGPWQVGTMRGFFRERDLSDRIGFDYARRDADEAVAELLSESARRGGSDGVVLIALDGENPWESWVDAGRRFRVALHAGMRQDGPTRGITLDEAAQRAAIGTIRRLHTGSWINADLRVWAGHEDDLRAWKLLAEARGAIDRAPADRRAAAIEKILPAEGSDWMWWMGPEFSTPFQPTFDALFRSHLKAVYEALGEPVPDALNQPVAKTIVATDAPRGPISPTLDRAPSWARWAGSGMVLFAGGPMARELPAHGVRYGWDDAGSLWVQIYEVRDGWTLAIEADGRPPTDARVFGDVLVARFDVRIERCLLRITATKGAERVELPTGGPAVLLPAPVGGV